MKPAILVPMLFVFACTATQRAPSKQDARRAMAALGAALDGGRDRATSSQHALTAPDSIEVAFRASCSDGGELAISGRYDYSTASADAQWDLDTAFSGCSDAHGTLDGDLHWTQSIAGEAISQTLAGNISWQDADGAASCAIDLALTVDAAGSHLSGTACGYAAVDVSSGL